MTRRPKLDWGPERKHPLPSQTVGSCHPGLDPGTSRIHPQSGNVAEYDWILNHVQDDGYREPRLNEGAFIIPNSRFLVTFVTSEHQPISHLNLLTANMFCAVVTL